MNRLFELIDQLSQKIPPSALKMIRLGALFVWVLGASIAIFFAWGRGQNAAPEMGQDLYLSEIKEKVRRERSLQDPPDVTIPDLQELLPDRERARSAGLSGGDESFTGQENLQDYPKEPPPLQGESESILFPEKSREPLEDRQTGEPGYSKELRQDLLPYPQEGRRTPEGNSSLPQPSNPSPEEKERGEMPAKKEEGGSYDLLPVR